MWLESLRCAQHQSKTGVTLSLLREFTTVREEDYCDELITTGLPLMFSILRTTKVPSNTNQVVLVSLCFSVNVLNFSFCSLLQNDAIIQQLAAIFSHCFGSAPLPSIPEMKAALSAQLGKKALIRSVQIDLLQFKPLC